MTAKSSTNKVPGSTLYCFIASGFWRYKCFWNQGEIVIASLYPEYILDSLQIPKSHFQAGQLRSWPIFKVESWLKIEKILSLLETNQSEISTFYLSNKSR